ncbi:BamA/TamA family outer membrane protein, partial [bacterium]|nr:BamA/TamA family outer membrane protein [bacterium]
AFTGAGQFFRIALMPGNVYSNYLVQYENPYWKHHEDGRNESFGWSVYYRTRDQGEWDETRIGLRLSRGLRKYKGDPDTDLIWHMRVEGVDVGNVEEPDEEGDDGAPEGAIEDEGSNVLLGFGPRIVRDRTDRLFLPSTGTRWELSLEGVVPYGAKLGAGATRYWSLGQRPLFHERVFSLRGSADYAAGSFPIFERYFAGAPMVRGFEYRGAGPHSNGEPDGGDYRAIISAQYRHPLVARTLYGVLFCDTGTVTENFSLYGEPRVAVGFGIRLFLPMLSRAPLSLDFGIPVADQSDDDTQTVYFSLAMPFGGARSRDRTTSDGDLTPTTVTE